MTEKRAPKRLALIIASYEYQDDSLRQLVAPAQDAEALARVLQDPDIGGFDEVKVLTNRPSHEVHLGIASFFADRRRDDLLLLYFSGHGVKDDDGRLYLATTDTRRKLLRATAVPATFTNETMSDSRSRRQVLVLDCCHSGAFARTKADKVVGIKEQVGGRGRVVLTSSDAVQYSFEGNEVIGGGVRSVFTSALVQGLETGEADRDRDGRVSLDELYEYVYERVVDETPKQRPQMFATVEGKIFIARNPRPIVQPTPQPAELPYELQRAIESPFAGLREGAVSELERLLHGSDEGLALAAHQALTLLANDDSRRVSAAAVTILAAYKAEQEKQAAKKREQEEQERRAHELAQVERAAREEAEKERQAQQRELGTLYQEAQTKIEGRAWAEAKDLCQQIETLEPGYRDIDQLLKQAKEKLQEEQAQEERQRLARLAAEKAKAEYATAERVEAKRRVGEEVDAGVIVLPAPPEPAEASQAQGRLRRFLNSVPTWVWALVGVAVVGAFMVLGSLVGRGPIEKPTPTSTHTPTDTPIQEPTPTFGLTTQTRSADGMVMVYVPGSTFRMGSDDGDESPQHLIILDPFRIDQIEITNAQYALCVADGECEESAYAGNSDYNGDNYPVVGVSWEDAVGYCTWAGAQLPTEAQWEYAAWGPYEYSYPWGNDTPTCELAQFSECSGDTVPVGSFPDGASWCGVLDMAGNALEWTSDWYSDYSSEVQANPTGPTEGEYKVLRGGSFGSNKVDIRTSSRSYVTPTDRYNNIGFRCVGVAPGQ